MNSKKILVLALVPMALTAQEARDVVPLKNWSNALYWHASQAEREATTKPLPQLRFSSTQVSPSALSFVAVTPCRLVDTRGSAAGFNGIAPFNGPSIGPAGTLTIPVQSSTEAGADTTPAPCGAIPSSAQAYSFNVTLVPKAGGQINYVTIWPSGSTQPAVASINDKQGVVLDNAAIVPAGTPQGGISIYNAGPGTTDVVIDMNGFFSAPSDLNANTATGSGALVNNTTGGSNTAMGVYAMQQNSSGQDNTANGVSALANNQTGSSNTALGVAALFENQGGGYNTAIGADALSNNLYGTNNIGIGYDAGVSAPSININSIYIGSLGTSSDASGTIQIGTQGTQTGGTFIAGIYGAVAFGGTGVIINSDGRLGTANAIISSRLAKERIADMGDSSSKLYDLRPVNFYYKPEYDDGSHTLQYGLIAEEVADVFPEMVTHGTDGNMTGLKYQMLTPMLLNELQKQAAENREQAEQIREQAEQNRRQAEENRSLEARLAALEALLSAPSDTVQHSAGAPNR